jgi:hypothetical protein
MKIIFPFFENALAYYNACAVVVNFGANPMIARYNASIVKLYNARNSRARFQNENCFTLL